MKKILAYLVIFLLVVLSAALGVVSVLLYANQQTLNSKVDQLNQQLESEKKLNETLKNLVDDKPTSSTTNPSTPTTTPTTKTFSSTYFDMKFDYPVSFGEAKSELSQGIEYVTFTSSEFQIHFPSSEGGFDPEGYNQEVVASKDGHAFTVFTLKQVVDDAMYKPSVSAFFNANGIVAISASTTKANYVATTNQVKDLIKSMVFTNAKK